MINKGKILSGRKALGGGFGKMPKRAPKAAPGKMKIQPYNPSPKIPAGGPAGSVAKSLMTPEAEYGNKLKGAIAGGAMGGAFKR